MWSNALLINSILWCLSLGTVTYLLGMALLLGGSWQALFLGLFAFIALNLSEVVLAAFNS